MLETSYKNSWENGRAPRNWQIPKLQWWLCRENLSEAEERGGHLGDALPPAQLWCRGGIPLELQPVWMEEKRNVQLIHIPIVSHPRADLRENKRPHIEILTAFKETHEHSSNICTVFPYWKKSRGVLSVYYTFLKGSKCDPGY